MSTTENNNDKLRQSSITGIREFANSELFTSLFDEGMALIEETTQWLAIPGRNMAQSLRQDLSLAYASHSLEMTTRLMYVAAWLIAYRAVRNGEIEPEQAITEFHIPDQPQSRNENLIFPSAHFSALYSGTKRFWQRIRRIDHTMRNRANDGPAPIWQRLAQLEAMHCKTRA